MESAETAVREGNLDEALALLQQEVRRNPAANKPRIFLFQLFAVLGEWKRALNQLDVLHDLDTAALAMVGTYRQVIQCELARAEVFSGRRTPTVFGDPEPWMALLVEALRLSTANRHGEAQALREQAFADVHAASGTLDAAPFTWIADADSRLGPMLEVIANGQYYWVPFHRVQAVELMPPTDLRDLVWLPARFVWINGGESFGFVPSRYAGSETQTDSALRLARKTDWIEVADGVYHGLGQRMLATDEAEYSLLDSRLISLSLAQE